MEIKLKHVMLIISIITCFVFIVSFSIYYVQKAIYTGNICNCTIPIPIIILVLASLGLFVGSFTYYFMINKLIKVEKKIESTKKNLMTFTDLLVGDEKRIIKFIIENKGKVGQSSIVKNTGINKVKVSRIIDNLVKRDILDKIKEKKTNIIKLKDKFADLLLKQK